MSTPALNTATKLPGIRTKTSKGRVVECVETYQVFTARTAEAPRTATNLPLDNDKHGTYTHLRVDDRGFTQEEIAFGKRWLVQVSYRILGDPAGTPPDPTVLVKKLSWGGAGHVRDLTTDAITGEPVLNSAKDMFDGVPQVPVEDLRVVMVRRENSLPNDILPTYHNTVNDAAGVAGGITVPKYCGYMEINCERIWDDDDWAYEYTYTVTIRTNKAKLNHAAAAVDYGWRFVVLDAGYRDINGKTLMVPSADDDGELKPATRPVKLGVDGLPLADPAHFNNKIFNAIRTASWAGLAEWF